MYFGTPSPQGKFYKGLHSDTPVNHDLHWRDRVVKENHMVKALNKRRAKDVPNADMFIKRPWTELEDQQLRDAVRRHGPNNWDVVCRDRIYIEMIGNHTQEDIKTRWRLIEKTRRTRKQRLPASELSQTAITAPKPGATQQLGVMNQLKLKNTLVEETKKRETLASEIERERRARLEAEKQAALQMRERKKLQMKLAEFESLVRTAKGSQSAPILPRATSADAARPGHEWAGGAARPPRHPGASGAGGGAPADDYDDDLGSRVSRTSHRSRRSRRDDGGSVMSGSAYTRSTRRSGRSEVSARSVRSHLSTSSSAIAASQRTRERARAALDSLKE